MDLERHQKTHRKDHKNTPETPEESSKCTFPVCRSRTAADRASARRNSLGVEQEFFVLDRLKFLARPDLLLSGRTLQGAAPAKGQVPAGGWG